MPPFVSSAESQAFDYTHEIISRHPAVFIKRPVYEKKLLVKNYIESTVLYDGTETILSSFKWEKEVKRFYNEFPEEVNANEYKERPDGEQPIQQEIPKQ